MIQIMPRPRDLPDFGAPPVTEVVLGVQFNALDRFLTPHLGLAFLEFKEQFPVVEEHPPLDPVFETFVEKGSPITLPRIQFQFMAAPPTPRIFMINEDKTEILQIQRDRFIHNWRKVGVGDRYPRFERMLETFQTGYRKFESLLTRENLGAIVPNQCEITYINQIPTPDGVNSFDIFEKMFGTFAKTLVLDRLGQFEDARFLLRYVVRDTESQPLGRLIITAEPALKMDGSPIVQFTLLVRGRPASADLDGVRGFLAMGREHIVHAFTNLTTAEMHMQWDRRQ
jgi:uncharacterized protein (TIGR04255 family)